MGVPKGPLALTSTDVVHQAGRRFVTWDPPDNPDKRLGIPPTTLTKAV
jgi:hypothetical protein